MSGSLPRIALTGADGSRTVLGPLEPTGTSGTYRAWTVVPADGIVGLEAWLDGTACVRQTDGTQQCDPAPLAIPFVPDPLGRTDVTLRDGHLCPIIVQGRAPADGLDDLPVVGSAPTCVIAAEESGTGPDGSVESSS